MISRKDTVRHKVKIRCLFKFFLSTLVLILWDSLPERISNHSETYLNAYSALENRKIWNVRLLCKATKIREGTANSECFSRNERKERRFFLFFLLRLLQFRYSWCIENAQNRERAKRRGYHLFFSAPRSSGFWWRVRGWIDHVIPPLLPSSLALSKRSPVPLCHYILSNPSAFSSVNKNLFAHLPSSPFDFFKVRKPRKKKGRERALRSSTDECASETERQRVALWTPER